MNHDRSDDDDYSEEEETEIYAERPTGTKTLKCLSCLYYYASRDFGTCKECFEEAKEIEEKLKREVEDLKSKVEFLRSSWGSPLSSPLPFPDVLLVASDDSSPAAQPSPIPAHRAVLACRSPVFRAMLENKMEESLSGTIKIGDVSYDALRIFVNYMYTGEASLDENMAYDLLVLAEKYQVQHLKTYCEKSLKSCLTLKSSIPTYAFAQQHNAKILLDASLSMIMENMEEVSKREEYAELVEKDPRMIVEIYEAYLKKQVNTASNKYRTKWP